MKKEPRYPRQKDLHKTIPPRMEGRVKNARMLPVKKQKSFRYLRG